MDFAEFWPSDAPSLSEAKNYIEKYQNKKIILKYGGQVMATDQLSKAFAQDAAVCKRVGAIPIVIHGGGPQIKEKLKQQNLESKFILGLRVTDEKVIKVVEEVLLNEINPDLVNTIKKYGVLSEPITVRNKNIIHIAKAINPELGFVGDPDQINVELLNSVINDNIVPVIAPMGLDATEYSMPAIDEVLGFHKVAKYNLFPGWHQVSTSTHFMINLDSWKKMK